MSFFFLYELAPKSVLYLVVIEESILNFMQNAIFAVLFCHVFSLFSQTATNASLPSLQNAIYPLKQSQRTIPHTVNSTGNGALNTRHPSFPHLLCTF